MGRLFIVLLVLAAIAGGGVWLATQPSGGVQPVQPSSAAVIVAEARIFAAVKAAGLKAVLTRSPQPVQVRLDDQELTSLVDSRLAQSTTTLSNAVLRGGADGAFHTSADVAWNGLVLHVTAAMTVSFDQGGALRLHFRDASVGRLPLPPSLVDSLVAQSQDSSAPSIPQGISGVALLPVAGGAVLSATASPSLADLVA